MRANIYVLRQEISWLFMNKRWKTKEQCKNQVSCKKMGVLVGTNIRRGTGSGTNTFGGDTVEPKTADTRAEEWE